MNLRANKRIVKSWLIMNESIIWNEIYKKESNQPGWSKPGPDKNISEIVNNYLVNNRKERVNILDIGCGNGRNSLIFDNISKPYIHYTGIDFSDSAIDYCQNSYSKNKRFIKQDITGNIDSLFVKYRENNFESGFDLVIDCGCFHSIEPDKRAMYIENLMKLTNPESIYIMGAWYKKESNMDIIKPTYFPYFSISEWLFDTTDIKSLFAPHFILKSGNVDKTIYPDVNDGFAYFVLSKAG